MSPEPKLSRLGRAALAYAERFGWRVHPLTPGAKSPPLTLWKDTATTDPEQIRAWWAQWPDANIALVTGKDSGVSALDVDVKDGAPGELTLRGLIEKYAADLAEHVCQRTPTGGLHYVFAYDPRARQGTKCYGPGLDGRNDGGYIVVAPSVIDGKAYEWIVKPDGQGGGCQPFPEWLLKAAEQVKPTPAEGERKNPIGWADALMMAGVPEGQRDDAAWRLICHARETGRSEADCWARLVTFGGNCTKPFDPKTDKNIAAKISRAYARPSKFGLAESQEQNREVSTGPGADLVADPELHTRAQVVLELDDPLVVLREAIQAQGYGGSLDPPIIVYIAVTTRLLRQRTGSSPCHLLIIATSGGGKTYTEQLVCLFLPESAIHRMTAGSARALIYDKGDLEHRTLLFGEADSLPSDEDNPAASAIRALLQDNELSYDVVVKEPKGNGYITKHIRRPGPTQFVTTSTKRFRDHQMATRVFELEIPTDAVKVKAALKVQAQLTNEPARAPAQALVDFQAYLQSKAPWDVAVPYANALADLIGQQQHDPRILRDFTKLLALVKAVAVLRHARRQQDEHGRVVATLDDYATVRDLVGGMYEAAVTGATEGVRQVADAVRAGAKSVPDVAQAVAVVTGEQPLPRTVRRWIGLGLSNGWLVNEESNPRKPKILSPGEPVPQRALLPSLEAVREWGQPTPMTEPMTADRMTDPMTAAMSVLSLVNPVRRSAVTSLPEASARNPEEMKDSNGLGAEGAEGASYGKPMTADRDPGFTNKSNDIAADGRTVMETAPMTADRAMTAGPRQESTFCPVCHLFRCQCKGAA